MSTQSIVSDLFWVLVRNGGRWILLRSSAAEMSGLQKDTEDSGPGSRGEVEPRFP